MKEAIKAVRKMMEAGDQAYPEASTADLYRRLMEEELGELIEAEQAKADGAEGMEVEEFDACLDLIWVTVGYMLARGWLIRSGWEEVARSNHAKIDAETGKMLRREDGKILKPEGWKPPDLSGYLA